MLTRSENCLAACIMVQTCKMIRCVYNYTLHCACVCVLGDANAESGANLGYQNVSLNVTRADVTVCGEKRKRKTHTHTPTHIHTQLDDSPISGDRFDDAFTHRKLTHEREMSVTAQ